MIDLLVSHQRQYSYVTGELIPFEPGRPEKTKRAMGRYLSEGVREYGYAQGHGVVVGLVKAAGVSRLGVEQT